MHELFQNFPAASSLNLLKMHLYSGKNHLYASQGKAAANLYGDLVEQCIKRDEELAHEMNGFKEGKWAGMELASHIGFTNWNDEDWRYPVRHTVRLPEKSRLVVSRADKTAHYTNQYFPKPLIIDDFAESDCEYVKIQIANGGQGTVSWTIAKGARKVGMDGISRESDSANDCEWLVFSQMSGETKFQDELVLKVKKEKIPIDETVECSFEIKTEKEFVPVLVRARRRNYQQVPDHTFVSENGIFVMNAEHFANRADGIFEGQTAQFRKIEDFGKFESGMKVFPVTASFKEEKTAPSLAYQIWADNEGEYILELHTSPANPLLYGGKIHIGVNINQKILTDISLMEDGYKGGEPGCIPWEKAVLDQEHIGRLKINIKKGLNEIRISAREAGIVLERLLVYEEKKAPEYSYLGPEESGYVINGKIYMRGKKYEDENSSND